MGCLQSSSAKYAVNTPEQEKKEGAATPSEKKDTVQNGHHELQQPGINSVVEDAPVITGSGAIVTQPLKRAKLDPKDFQYVALTGEVHVKQPGTINGQAFMIDNCQDCDLYILDFCGQVTVDDCKNCRIFVGPCEGSVFLRDCSNCSFAVIARQLRTRDIHNCNISLLCRTRPIVESSSNVGFGCFDMPYPQLEDHLAAAKMNPLHNFWYYVFDFTPKEGNWRLLPAGLSAAMNGIMAPIPAQVASLLGSGDGQGGVLVTAGDREPRPDGEYMFTVFASAHIKAAMQLARAAAAQGTLLRCNQAKVSADMAGKMAAEAKWARSVERDLTSEQCIGVEYVLPLSAVPAMKELAHSLKGHTTDSEEAAALFRYLGID